MKLIMARCELGIFRNPPVVGFYPTRIKAKQLMAKPYALRSGKVQSGVPEF